MRAKSLRTFNGAVAIITGAASGIGAALARALAAGGATVIAADRQYGEAPGDHDAALPSAPSIETVALDVRDANAVERVVADVFSRYGRLDYLFNNAGMGIGGEVLDVTSDDWRDIVDVNVLGVAYGIRAAYGRMVSQGFGHIVNTASMAGWMATPMATAYCATKHAVVGLSRSLRAEARVHGIRVSVLCPGVIRTGILVGGGRYGRLTTAVPSATQLSLWERLHPMDADRFAALVLQAIARNRGIIIVPQWWRALDWLNRLSPTLADALAAAMYVRVRDTVLAAAASDASSDRRRAA
jgi:NAD(P)-dependent dehydrogenase (short-subunit alcohol dehydrogenase family)